MFFLNHSKDTPLLQELIREGVFNSGFWESLQLPAEGHLMDVLLANYLRVAEKPWLDWLIRKHACTRIPSMEPTAAFIKAVDRKILSDCIRTDCYPLQVGDNHIFIGLGRPDYPDQLEALSGFYKKSTLYRNALSLAEIQRLRSLCHQALQTI